MHSQRLEGFGWTQFIKVAYNVAQLYPQVVMLEGHGAPDGFPTELAWGTLRHFEGTLGELHHFVTTAQHRVYGYFTFELKEQIQDLKNKTNPTLPEKCISLLEPLYVLKKAQDQWYFCHHHTADPQELESLLISSLPQIHFEWATTPNKYPWQAYELCVLDALDNIHKGNLYEVNYCIPIRFEELKLTPMEYFLELMRISPMPFSAFVKNHSLYACCASPERFIQIKDSTLVSQPIKGTAPRIHHSPQQDAQLARQLQHSEKEKAENYMIVDLVRNDMTKICEDGSVQATEVCALKTFAHVHQLESTIQGKVLAPLRLDTLFSHMFPMGSMTGAPKISAVDCIDRLESGPRGIFSGSIGYLDPDLNLDLNVVIRSFFYDSSRSLGWAYAGSALTAYTTAAQEWQECSVKFESVLNTLESLKRKYQRGN